jgi:hypothetical protein
MRVKFEIKNKTAEKYFGKEIKMEMKMNALRHMVKRVCFCIYLKLYLSQNLHISMLLPFQLTFIFLHTIFMSLLQSKVFVMP